MKFRDSQGKNQKAHKVQAGLAKTTKRRKVDQVLLPHLRHLLHPHLHQALVKRPKRNLEFRNRNEFPRIILTIFPERKVMKRSQISIVFRVDKIISQKSKATKKLEIKVVMETVEVSRVTGSRTKTKKKTRIEMNSREVFGMQQVIMLTTNGIKAETEETHMRFSKLTTQKLRIMKNLLITDLSAALFFILNIKKLDY